MEASGNGRTAVVKILVNRGADKDKKNTVCHYSLMIHHCRVYYNVCPIPILQEGQSALYQASFYGHYDVVEALVDAKADVDTCSMVSPYQ